MWTESPRRTARPTARRRCRRQLPRPAALDQPQRRLGARQRKGWTAFAKLDQDLPGDWELRGALSAFHSEARLLSAISQGPFDPDDDYSYIIEGQLEGWDADVYSLDAYAAGPAQLFGREHELMIGLNGARTENELDRRPLRPDPLQIGHAFDHDPTTVPRRIPTDWPIEWPASDSTARTSSASTPAAASACPTRCT